MWTGEKMLLNRWNKSFHLSCGFHFSSGTFSPNNWTIWEVVFWGGTTLNWAKVNISSLRATSFNHTPFTYKTSDGRNGGWESKIVETMAESLNFRQSHVHMIHVQPPRVILCFDQAGHSTPSQRGAVGGKPQWIFQRPGGSSFYIYIGTHLWHHL